MVMAAVIAVLVASCQKENAIVDTPTANTYPAGTVNYIVGKVSNSRTVESAEQWNALVDECFDGADEGHLVTIAHGVTTNPSKERLTYTTESRETAMAWVKAKYEEGYDVTLWYDEEQGRYICVASKLAPPAGAAPNGFVFVPLQQYLPGSWTLCTDHEAVLAPHAAQVELDPNYGILTMNWSQIYEFYKIVPANISNNRYSMIHIINDTIHIDNKSFTYQVVSDLVVTTFYHTKRLDFRAYEWSSDTMLVYYRNSSNIIPSIYTRN